MNAKGELMCPACMASAAVMAGSVMSTGGIAALAVRIARGKKSRSEEASNNTMERRNDDGNYDDKQDGSGQDRAAR